MTEDGESEILRVLAHQGNALNAELRSAMATANTADGVIAAAEAALGALGAPLPQRDGTMAIPRTAAVPRIRSWEEIVAEAKAEFPSDPSFEGVLSPAEMAGISAEFAVWNSEFAEIHRLTRYDYAVAGIAGVLAGLADIMLVQVPKHPGFMGSQRHEGGWLSNVLKERFGKLFPRDMIRALENNFPVPYDASTNAGLTKHVSGIGPRTHRLHSLGHDPVLGWLFGVRDILMGQFTAVGADGRFVIQPVAGSKPAELGLALFVRLIDAFRGVGGHMLSDVATSAGLPPPFFCLTQFSQTGNIGGHNVSEVARAMYRSGYDFRHFLAGGITVALTEVIVRTAWTIRELSEGKDLLASLPSAGNPRLRSGLFLAHAVATAMNAGKVAVMRSPLALNWAQWLAFFRYLMPQLCWVTVGKENERATFVQAKLDEQRQQIGQDFANDWATMFGHEPPAVI